MAILCHISWSSSNLFSLLSSSSSSSSLSSSSSSSSSRWSTRDYNVTRARERSARLARFPGLYPRRSYARRYAGSTVHLSIGVHRFNHPFIRPHVHAPVSLTMRAGPLGPSDRTRSRRVVSCVRGVADLTEGVVAPVRLGPLSPHHVFLSFSILLLINFACARALVRVRARASAATDLLSSRQRLASTIAVCDGRSSSFLPLFPSFVLVFLLLFSFFHFPSLRPLASWSSSLLSYVLSISLKPRLCSRVQKKL